MNENDTVLNGRYTLVRKIPILGIGASELWEATDAEAQSYTLKITPYTGVKPSLGIRRLWDNDLRVMYRLSSSPDAERQLIVMKDAGVDDAKGVMIIVYEGGEYVTLADMLKNREQTDWLSFTTLKERHIRRELWCSLLRLAKGLKSLHDQNLIHRHFTPESIWGGRGENSESLRLSGFDWSARIGQATNFSERSPWATPPELKCVGYSFSSDWYGFGTTVARIFHKIEHFNAKNFDVFGMDLEKTASRENPCNLGDLEKNFIASIIAQDRLDRLQRAADILERIEKIIEALDFGRTGSHVGRRVLLHINARDQNTIDVARGAGFVVNPDDPFEAYEPDSAQHSVRLKNFMVDQLRNAALGWSLDGRGFELKCPRLFVHGEKWMDYGERKEQSWKAAKARLNRTRRLSEFVPANGFDDVRIEVDFNHNEINRKIQKGSGFNEWNNFFPKEENSRSLSLDSEYLRQFLHASNQFELLLRDAEIFGYKIISKTNESSATKIIIASLTQGRPSSQFFKADKKLVEFIQQERDAAKQYSEYVLLTETDSLFVQRDTAFKGTQSDWVKKSQWTIQEIDLESETITLFRQHAQGLAEPPLEGYLRTRGHYGQIRLIERRKEAIDRLISHPFLLRTLATPDYTSIDTGDSALPWRQIEDRQAIDANKLAIIKDILRTRPMYALQGPPGTGKSTLVAHLLRQILEDDPMAQILVTSKDHAAVDVLLDKVMGQAYKDVAAEHLPLAIRLNRRDGKDGAKEQADNMIQTTSAAIDNVTASSLSSGCRDIQRKWRDLLQQTKDCQDEDENEDIQSLSNALVDLVRRGASITYCTTSSGDLEELAKGTRSFDWSIIEEAGKTHGFDLALPLQAGHRWLLLGDHKQLRPFLYDEFADCFDRLTGEHGDGSIDILDALGGGKRGNARLIDIEWIKGKLGADDKWANAFPNYARNWLSSLERIVEMRRKLNGVTQDNSVGASVGLLTKQYRMPPAIGNIISTVFYKEALSNETADAQSNPHPNHRNPFAEPTWLAGHSLIWLDIPWTEENKEFRQTGYSNQREQQAIGCLLQKMRLADTYASQVPTVAILTPYNMQKNAINHDEQITAPQGCQFGSEQSRDKDKVYKAYSIDSFQGDEADVIIISLVRNKPRRAQDHPSPSDIQFVTQPDRLNVMLSRPRRLLIIVGCWDYLSACVADVSSATDLQGNYHDSDYGPFKRIIEEIGIMFVNGMAKKISVEEALS